MPETKHTPGPWIAGCDSEETEEANVILAGNVVIARVEDSPEIRERHNKGRVEGPGSQAGADAMDEVDANARLIAAAPDLLEAVKAAYPAILWAMTHTDGNQVQFAHVTDLFKTALAKAEGRP